MEDPIRRSIDLRVPVERAFATWTEQMDRWWPPGTALRPGRMTVWDPPHRVRISVSMAGSGESEVEARFRPTGPSSCQVEVEHRGWQAQAAVLLRRGRELGSAIEVAPAPAVACGGCGPGTTLLSTFRLLR